MCSIHFCFKILPQSNPRMKSVEKNKKQTTSKREKSNWKKALEYCGLRLHFVKADKNPVPK